MHIGLVIYGSLDTLTGGFLYDKYLVRHLESRGHRVEILALPWRSYGACLFQNFSRKLRTRLFETPFDILLQDELNHPSLFWLNKMLRKRARFPVVTIVHQVLCRQPRLAWQNALYRAIEIRYLTSVDAYIFNSNTTGTAIEQIVDIGKRPALVACPGGDRLGSLRSADATIRSRSHESGPLRLLLIGNVLPHKGVYELMMILSGIPKGMWQLTVIGSLAMDREYVHKVKSCIRDRNLGENIALMGSLDGDELAAYIARSHVFVMPFSHEGFGIVYLEAMAYGLPVIGSSGGAVQDLVRHGQNGFLIDPGDPEMLKQHLEKLYHDRNFLAKMGKAALETFHSYPTWAESMESIHQFLKCVALQKNMLR